MIQTKPVKAIAFLYALHLRDSSEIRYIGQTAGPVTGRFYQHQYDARRGVQRPVYLWMAKYYDDVVLSTLLACELELVDEYEIAAIAQARAAGHRLLNLADGGTSNRGWKMPESAKATLSASRKEWITPEHIAKMIEGRRNTPWTEAQTEAARRSIRKVAIAKKGVPHSPEHRAAISRAHQGKIIPLETILKMSATKKRRNLTEEEVAVITQRFNERQKERAKRG